MQQARGSPIRPWSLAVARVFALSAAVLLVISLTHFFIIPTICIALVAVCFAIASVAAPEEG